VATLREVSRVIDESSGKLLQIGSPPVRYWLLSDVLGKGPEDRILLRTREECCSYGPRIRLLNRIDRNGFWSMGKRHLVRLQPGDTPQGWELTLMIKNLFRLLQYCTEKSDGRVDLVIENIFTWQTEEGYIPGTWTTVFPIPYVNGQILYELSKFGLEDDRRVRRLRAWLLSMQRRDGGWNIPYRQDVFYLPQYRRMGVLKFLDMLELGKIPEYDPGDSRLRTMPSCTWSTVYVLMGLCEKDDYRMSYSARRGFNFLLDRVGKTNPHKGFWQSAGHWKKLKYPLFESGGIAALDVMTKLTHPDLERDPRLERAIDWLISARNTERLWTMKGSASRESDEWLTLWAVMILHRYITNA